MTEGSEADDSISYDEVEGPYNKGLVETLWLSSKNVYGYYVEGLYQAAIGRYRDVTALTVMGFGLIGYAMVTAIQYQGLLNEHSIDGGIAFGMLAGLNGAGVVLIVAAAAIAVTRIARGRIR